MQKYVDVEKITDEYIQEVSANADVYLTVRKIIQGLPAEDVVPRAEVLKAIEEIEKKAHSRLLRFISLSSQNPYFVCDESDALRIVTRVLAELKNKYMGG